MIDHVMVQRLKTTSFMTAAVRGSARQTSVSCIDFWRLVEDEAEESVKCEACTVFYTYDCS